MAQRRLTKRPVGQNVYVQISTYDPKTRSKRHRGSIALKRFPVAQVRQVLIDAFTALQTKRGDEEPQVSWFAGCGGRTRCCDRAGVPFTCPKSCPCHE